MQRRAWRVGLVVLFVMICAAAAFEVARLDGQITVAGEAGTAMETVGGEARRAVIELRAAQAAYVAAGQDRDYWLARVTAMLEFAAERLAALAQGVQAPEARSKLDSAAATVTHFSKMDDRARELIGGDQTIPASDLIFTDGLELTDAADDEIASALETERLARGRARRQLRVRQATVIAGAAVAGLLFMLLLAPGAKQAAPAAPEMEDSLSTLLSRTAVRDLSLDLDAAPSESGTGIDVAGDLAIELDTDAAIDDDMAAGTPIIDAPVDATPADLAAVAALCTDLARVSDGEQLPALLERAAGLLEASGVIVWLTDSSNRALRAVIAHGYPSDVLGSMGELPCDGDNAAAHAFRTSRVQIVDAGDGARGALVAPLLAASGCVGVVTAELSGEIGVLERATVSILAAQLVVLLVGNAGEDAEAGDVDAAKTGTA
ncbi:MAG: hypothetical protein QGG24_00695 [Vicinamibacterales bacterium]|jgi:hypothetical protein|nr:hypothetical protein [Acidobacteriota bacterium]MDP7293813.1 hypothetical protein [Vicinamibacterales bacterium]MDP7473055.1 hypothetical protein [Vicinamibacterales bacterium]MDP7670911.1 hypothetical protein [Vicinamibacterales bacterium]HJO39655.1 hypothetical protein [Vicinamibacterales bacterium]